MFLGLCFCLFVCFFVCLIVCFFVCLVCLFVWFGWQLVLLIAAVVIVVFVVVQAMSLSSGISSSQIRKVFISIMHFYGLIFI